MEMGGGGGEARQTNSFLRDHFNIVYNVCRISQMLINIAHVYTVQSVHRSD